MKELIDFTDDKDTDLEPADETANRIVLGCLIALLVFASIGIYTCILGLFKIIHP